MTDENKRKNIAQMVEKADRDLEYARQNLDIGAYEVVVSLSYYAALCYARALLLTEDLEARTHSGAGNLLGLHFVTSGRLAPEHARALAHLQKDREDADYSAAAVFTKGMAEAALRDARSFRDAARALLEKAQYL